MEQIVIIKKDGSRVPIINRNTATAITSAKQTWTINADDTIEIVVKSATPRTFDVGDKIVVFGRTYKLNRLPKIQKTGTATFQYTLSFEGAQYDLMAATYDVNIDTTGNVLQDVQGESLTGDLSRFMDVLVSNANRVWGSGVWSVGDIISGTDGDTTISFSESDNCLSVLQSLCTKFDCEFEINETDGRYTINMVKQTGQEKAYTFRYGRGRGLYTLTRENVSSSNIITRLKVYGSTENITTKYRADRLCLPGCTKSTSLIQKADAVARYGIYEAKKYFDVKPTFTGCVEAVVDGDVLSFIDTTIDFDINAKDSEGNTKYLVSGQSAKVHFNSGNLAGYEFEMHAYDHATHKVTLIRQTDERGAEFPSDTSAAFRFGKGDKYKLLNITLPDEWISAAEAELQSTAEEYYDQNCQPKVQYGLTFEKLFIERTFGSAFGTSNVFHPGDRIRIQDDDIGVDKYIRIKSIQRDILDEYDYTLTIADTTTTTITNRVISELNEIETIINTNHLRDVAKARRNWMASRELLNMVFDTEGDYYSEKIKPLSIETQMLAVGARSQQFTLGVTFHPNYKGDPNTLVWDTGVLTHFVIENEIRMWQISSGNMVNISNEALYIYACCNKNGTEGYVELSNEQMGVESISGAYMFLVGLLSSPIADSGDGRSVRTISLTYGSTTINGRTIQTGCIRSSGDGTCYFDLDNNEIGGILKFVDYDGTTKAVADVNEVTQANNKYINATLQDKLTDIYNQLDGLVETWFGDVAPTLDNAPAKDWTTAELRENHLGDTYYDNVSGYGYRFSKTSSGEYKWVEITDSAAVEALAAAAKAQDTADGKRRVFVDTPYPPYDSGDLWVQGASGDIYVCKTARTSDETYVSSDWAKASKYTDDSALSNFIRTNYSVFVNTTQSQIDGKIETWYQASDPAASWLTDATRKKHVGDIWYKTTDKTCFRYCSASSGSLSVYAWQRIYDADALEAITAALGAQETADSKRQVFLTTPYPPYDVGDLWVDGTDLRTCVTAKNATESYSINDWDIKVGYDNTKTTIDGGLVTSGTIQVAGDNTNILAGMTGKGTAADSVRFWSGASYENRATAPYRVLQDGTFYATKGNISGVINANTGSIGGFEIAYGRIGAANTGTSTSAKGLTLAKNYIIFSDSSHWASIGTNVLPLETGLTGVGRFSNSASNAYGTNYGLLVNVSGALHNIAIGATGTILATNVYSRGFANITPAANEIRIPGDLTTGGFDRILVHIKNSNSGIGFPTRQSVAEALNIDTNTSFMFHMTIICAADSTQNGFIRGRNSDTSGMSSANYPMRLDNKASAQTGKLAIAKGDVQEFMLVYDGTNYYAYWLNQQN